MASRTAGTNKPFEVKGTIRLADGSLAGDARVAAFDTTPRKERLLGKAAVGRDGAYRIRYGRAASSRGRTGLLIKVFDAKEKLLAASPIQFDVPPVAVVDLTIPAAVRPPPSQFQTVSMALQPALHGLEFTRIEENGKRQDLTFLAGATGLDKALLARFALAHQLAQKGLPAELWFAVLGGRFFLWTEGQTLAAQLATLSASLASLDVAAVAKALTRAFQEGEIAPTLKKQVPAWLEAFADFLARAVLAQDADGKPSFLLSALEHAGVQEAAAQGAVGRLFNEHRALTPQVLATLEQERILTKAQSADLQASFRLADVIGADFAVVAMVKDHFKIADPAAVPSLATHPEAEWVTLVEKTHAAGTVQLPLKADDVDFAEAFPAAEIFGKTLARQVRQAFPTQAFAGDLRRTLEQGGTPGLAQGRPLNELLGRHPVLDLLSTPLDAFLDRLTAPADTALARDSAFRRQLKSVQRVFKVAPTFDAVDALLRDGLHSAQQIYRLGETAFVRRYAGRAGLTADDARKTWRRAADTHAAVLTIVSDLKALDGEALPQVLKNGEGALAAFPNWDTLFKNGDLCDCEHCNSVLGPAAYFADLLVFLSDRASAAPSVTVKDVLFGRRPDLGFLELGCDNALTPLPYIDVVCEVLEAAVAAGANDRQLQGFSSMPNDPTAAKAAVVTALAAAQLEVGAEVSLSQVSPSDPDRWVVHGELATYLLKKKATPNFFAEILRNTKASAEEVRAYPQHVDPKAYELLRQARFPSALPFDLFAEEVRAAFAKSNLQRWELMQAFHGPAAPNDPTDGEIAAEAFGISCDAAAPFDERRLILVADTTVVGQQAIWGEAGSSSWLDTLSNVRTFLQKTGLEYVDLGALLDLPFVNPNGDLVIHHQDSSCDTSQKVIEGLDAASLDRIHRFLRLWRKLDVWKLWEVDAAIRCSGVGAGKLDEAFLINLHALRRLQRRLGAEATTARLCALFDDLGTETHFVEFLEKREEGLYQSLFLNKRLIQPLDAAFAVNAVDVSGPTLETISGHRPTVLSALGLGQTELELLTGLARASDGLPYINDDLTLGNLSFLWRHAWLAKRLRLKIAEWKTLLALGQEDVLAFADAQDAWRFVERADQVRTSGFSIDELAWILAADRAAKAADKEAAVARLLSGLRAEIQAVQSEYAPATYPLLDPPTDLDRLSELLGTLLQQLRRDEGAQRFIACLRDEVSVEANVAGLPAGFAFPPAITASIRIRHDEPAGKLRFTGLMTTAARATLLGSPALAPVTGLPAYQDAIDALFEEPRLELKFLDQVFSAPLEVLPASVDFRGLSDAALAQKISFDAEARALRFVGILSVTEKAILDGLSALPEYRSAVDRLFTEPRTGTFGPEALWLQDADLVFPLRDAVDPANDNLALNVATAVKKGLAHLAKTLSEGLVVRRASAELGISEAIARRLLTAYPVLPETLLAHLTGTYAATGGVVDYATVPDTFDGWFWARRVAALWKKWKLTLVEWDRLEALVGAAQLLDVGTLPLTAAAPPPALERFLETSRLLGLRDALPETELTLLEVLVRLNTGQYAAVSNFAADVEHVNGTWHAAEVEALVGALDLTYPGGYLRAGSWERLRRAFSFTERLNANVATLTAFAAATMTDARARTLKGLLRSKLEGQAWIQLSTEIQDALRNRKRDALAAYLLGQAAPTDAPSGKWENTNDLYSYYLLDVEMCACQLTSRLVQGSGSVQLFVQRAFMGLEPQVRVEDSGAEGDSAWRWWAWMRKYRVWEANRKVFLWPENWIEPELRADRSPFFKDLEKDLLQGELTTQSAETAFARYLEQLDGVAQLEIAGFYQQEDGDEAIVHVFGRTPGAAPHVYYHRRYDYRQWTPWEKVDLDIEGDYLVPAVVNQRLFLFWPVFTEVPDEAANSAVSTPSASQSGVPIQKTIKRHRVQLAFSDFRQGDWAPKKVSKDYYESSWITVIESVHKYHRFLAIDRSNVDGRFLVKFDGYSLGSDGYEQGELTGAFEIGGCKGVPELVRPVGNYKPVLAPEWASVGQYPSKAYTAYMKWNELGKPDEFGHLVGRHDLPENDFTLENAFAAANAPHYTPVLLQTPWLFRMSPSWQLSYLDRLLLDGLMALSSVRDGKDLELPVPMGAWLPFFYSDKMRTFFVLPALAIPKRGDKTVGTPLYAPEVTAAIRRLERQYESLVAAWVDGLKLETFTPAQRQLVDQLLWRAFPEEAPPPLPGGNPPPYTPAEAEEARRFLRRWVMRFFHLTLGGLSLQAFQSRRFHFKNFYHPFTCSFAKLLQNPLRGVPALMRRETQLQDSGFSFKQRYQPTSAVLEPGTETFYPREDVDFTPDGAYSPYNWELFFHAPLLIANELTKNQRFAEARDWYHFIFNPIGHESSTPGGSASSKYWLTKPFYQTTDPQYVHQRIENILRMLAGDASLPGYSDAARQALERQVIDWRTHPFEPHRIAAYRTVAYQKTVVMKYLDNLIAWGDNLFRQDSMESINEATQLYILAAELLGPRPKKVAPQAKPPLETFNEMEASFDSFANALVEVENFVPALGDGAAGGEAAPLPLLYFCIPRNEKLLAYWDTIADRLYKIRHCMNIDGVVRQLALFEPPIDPGALVKAVAAGVDIDSALADLNTPHPLYRFTIVLQKANEVCNDVKVLGSELLTALERNDAEGLSLLRQGQEVRLLQALRLVKSKQVDEARENLQALIKGRELSRAKKSYYDTRSFMNAAETLALSLTFAGAAMSTAIGLTSGLAATTRVALPQFTTGGAGFGGSPVFTISTGGDTVANASEDTGRMLSAIAAGLEKSGGIAGTLASYQRRSDDWKHQAELATREIEQADVAIAAAQLRVELATGELEIHDRQIADAQEVDAFMRSKYTNQELYQWQLGQLTGVYFRAYRLAYDLARQAERCLRFELGLQTSSYISFGYWDSLKKGLLSGEKLQQDLRALEVAHLQQNRRELELTKHVSLVQLDPLALVRLRETGRCFFQLPEEIFDLDFPGHYFRRIKSVSLTLPCIAGPYTTISCTLRLLSNSIRINTAAGDDGYPRNTDDAGLPADDPRFVENQLPVNAIATSGGQNDSGMFELSFRDDRYLPFEGGGAISSWSLELFSDLPSNNPDPAAPDFGRPLRQFDYDTITDAVLHLKFTAREDAGGFKNDAIAHLRDHFTEEGTTPGVLMLNLRRDFPSQWARFLNPTSPGDDNTFELDVGSRLFPLRDAGKTLQVNALSVLARCADAGAYTVTLTPPLPASPPAASTMSLVKDAAFGGLHRGQRDVSDAGVQILPVDPGPTSWRITVTRPGGGALIIDPVTKVAEVQDLMLILGYEWGA